MKLIGFKEWCKSHRVIHLIYESEMGGPFDLAGIDAIILYNGCYKPIQYRIRETSQYHDITVRKLSKINNEDRSYKIQNVPLFIYITPEWWVIVDTKFYTSLKPDSQRVNDDRSEFYTYKLVDLQPFIVDYYNIPQHNQQKSLGDVF